MCALDDLAFYEVKVKIFDPLFFAADHLLELGDVVTETGSKDEDFQGIFALLLELLTHQRASTNGLLLILFLLSLLRLLDNHLI